MSRENQILENYYLHYTKKIDHMMIYTFAVHFVLGVTLAIVVSPYTWEGRSASVHIHVFAAIIIGLLASVPPIYCCYRHPGQSFNKYIVAIGLMSYSVLLIHLTGGRIETHFHIFGALAIIAFYRDPKALILATTITAIDHAVRGVFWPESVYGVLTASPWRVLEHAAWVVFENIFLIVALRIGWDEMREIAQRQAEVESLAAKRTSQLEETNELVQQQQAALASSAKLSALGEMAGGIAHEINTPLNVITLRTDQIEMMMENTNFDVEKVRNGVDCIRDTTLRISKIVKGLKSFSRDGANDPVVLCLVDDIIESTMELCHEQIRNRGILFQYQKTENEIEEVKVPCRETEISQVLLNLINNSRDAVDEVEIKWIKVEVVSSEEWVEISVLDSGKGVPQEVKDKVLQPFFTTKEVGKGTGLGLSISRNICRGHGGDLILDDDTKYTKFTIRLPKHRVLEVARVG